MRLLNHILYIESRTLSMIEKNQALFLNKAWPTTQTQNKTRQNYYSIILSMQFN